jgi:hypothetical protein
MSTSARCLSNTTRKGAAHEQDQRSQRRHRRSDVVYWLTDPEMRFAYGVKYLRFNRKTNILTPIGWSGERMGPDADLVPGITTE